MVIRGHSRPAGVRCCKGVLSSVHGQPVLRGGGGGSSLKVGQRMGLLSFSGLIDSQSYLTDDHWVIGWSKSAFQVEGARRSDNIDSCPNQAMYDSGHDLIP